MKMRKRSTVSILREILGPLTGSESTFAAVTGLSTSWVNKASYNKIPITPKAAQRVSSRTGVSANWLLCGKNHICPMERDEQTPYTRESYDRHVESATSATKETPEMGASQNVATIIGSFIAGIESGKGKSAANDLWECAQLMLKKYGTPRPDGESWKTFTMIQDEIQKIARWGARESDPSEDESGE
jgi:hypothetical protein